MLRKNITWLDSWGKNEISETVICYVQIVGYKRGAQDFSKCLG